MEKNTYQDVEKNIFGLSQVISIGDQYASMSLKKFAYFDVNKNFSMENIKNIFNDDPEFCIDGNLKKVSIQKIYDQLDIFFSWFAWQNEQQIKLYSELYWDTVYRALTTPIQACYFYRTNGEMLGCSGIVKFIIIIIGHKNGVVLQGAGDC